MKVGDRFEQRPVKVAQRTESRVAIEGLAEGTEVALVDPGRRHARLDARVVGADAFGRPR